MNGSQQEFAKALSLVTRLPNADRVPSTSPSPGIPRGNTNNNNNNNNSISLIGRPWNSTAATAAALDYRQFTTPGISPPNSDDLDNSMYEEGEDDLFGSTAGFTDEAITDRLSRLRHLQRMSRKGKRQPNWSEAENNILVEQFEKYRDTLKPKRSEGVSARDKKEAWENICAAVNGSNAAALKRSAKDVRKKWENIRTWARKVITEWKHECNQTLKSGKTECPPVDPPELARRIMVIYDFDGIDDDGSFDDELDHPATAGETKYCPLRTQTDQVKYESHEDGDESMMNSEGDKSHLGSRHTTVEDKLNHKVAIKNEHHPHDSSSSRPASRSAITTPPLSEATPMITAPIAPPLNVPTRRYLRDGLLDYRLLDAARIQERFQQSALLAGMSSGGGDGNSSSIAPSTSPSPPPPKKPRRHSRQDEMKDINELQREVLILQKEKLVAEKEKIQMEKEKLKIEKENLLLERHRMISSPHVLLPMMS